MPNARKKAIDCLLRCERGGFSNLVLLQELASSGLDARDRGFCTALVYGTLSRKLTADSIISSCLDRPLAKLDAEVLEILRAGVYQIFWMDSVPARAAISESVDLCRAFRKSSAAPGSTGQKKRLSSIRHSAQPDCRSFSVMRKRSLLPFLNLQTLTLGLIR